MSGIEVYEIDGKAIERLADLACDVDSLKNRFPPEVRSWMERVAEQMHATASAYAQAAGLRLYVDDDGGDEGDE